MGFPLPAEARCSRCRQTLPVADFYARPNGKPDTYCKPCRRAYQRSRDPVKGMRRTRVNACGDVWCPKCRRYLSPDRFYVHKSETRRGNLFAYCKECDYLIKQQRLSDPARYARDLAGRSRWRRKLRNGEQMERRRFVAGAIATLGRRGCTQAMIANLFGTTRATIGEWARRTRLPVPNAAVRFAILLRETAHLPEGPEPVRRVKPFPGFDELVARVRPKVLRFPIRSKWKTFAEQAP